MCLCILERSRGSWRYALSSIGSLPVIRNYFHMIDLDPGFRIGNEGEIKLLKQDVAKEVLEAEYA